MMMTETESSLPPLNYERISQHFDRLDILLSPSEVHGMICGFVCAGNRINGKAWLEAVLGAMSVGAHEQRESRDLVITLYEKSSQQLKSSDSDFAMLLPDDDCSLEERAKAVGDWCNGVMTGMGLAGIHFNETSYTPLEDVQQALNHLWEIANIDYKSVDYTEDDEHSYMEVVEHVRIIIMMLYEEFAAAGSAPVGDITEDPLVESWH